MPLLPYAYGQWVIEYVQTKGKKPTIKIKRLTYIKCNNFIFLDVTIHNRSGVEQNNTKTHPKFKIK